MRVQIIIPILNPDNAFTTVLEMLSRQTVPNNILLIDSGDSQITGQFEKRSIERGTFNHANTRNIALEYTADLYLFMTQDALPYDSHLLTNLCKAFEDPDVVVAYARQLPYPYADPIEVFARHTNYPEHSCIKTKDDIAKMGIKTFFASDSCAMYRGEYFRNVAGFTKNLHTNEDMDFCARAILDHKKIAYVPDAKVYHSHNLSYTELWKRYRMIGEYFRNQSWILTEISKYRSAETTGMAHAINEIKFLFKTAPSYIPESILKSLIKFIAFKSPF
ncbi:MAG: glycosyltransferase family 2 protein [Sulfuricurvum sp.]